METLSLRMRVFVCDITYKAKLLCIKWCLFHKSKSKLQ